MARRLGGVPPLAARRYRGNERGLALVITLFVVALVTVLVLEYHFDATVELDLAANYANDVQAYHLALAGVRFAQALLQRDSNARSDGPESEWYKLGLVPACFAPQQLLALAAAGGGEGLGAGGHEAKASTDRRFEDASGGDVGCVSLRITDEDSKLPVNALMQLNGDDTAPIDTKWGLIFQAFFESFKIDPEVMDALADWMDTGDGPRGTGGAERAYYERLPVPYKPRDSHMRTPGELRLVKGLDNPEELAKLFPGATPEAVADLDLGNNAYLTTVWADAPKDAKVNLNTAPPEVLMALFRGLSINDPESMVQDIVAKRQAGQFDSVDKAVQDANLRQKLSVQSTYFRIESVGVVGLVRKRIVAVLQRQQQQGTQPTGAQPTGAQPTVRQPTGSQLTVNPPHMRYFKVE